MNEPDRSSAPSSRRSGQTAPEPESERSAVQERFHTIYTTIRERIALLDYLPDERLSEGDLADEFGVSRTPVRRVLARLEAERLLESRHGVGTFVTSLNMTELAEIYRLRKELVTLIGALDPNPVTEDILDEMRAVKASCREIAGAANPKKAFARINIAFFTQVMRLVGNEPLREMLELLFYRTARMWPALTSNEVIVDEAILFEDEIGDTIRFLEHGDIDAAGHLRRCHISAAFSRLDSYMAKKLASSG